MGAAGISVMSEEAFTTEVVRDLMVLDKLLSDERRNPGTHFSFFDDPVRFPTGGAEVEAHLVTLLGAPATGDANLRVMQRVGEYFPETGAVADPANARYRLDRRQPHLIPGIPSWLTPEVGSNTLEFITGVHGRKGDAMLRLEAELHERRRLVEGAAAELGFGLSYLANLPSIFPEDMTVERALTQGPKRERYETLFRAMSAHSGGRHPLSFRSRDPADPEGVQMVFDSPIPVITICAWQTHLGLHPVHFARVYNLLALVDVLFASGSTNGAPLFGKRVGRDIRYDMWKCTVGGGKEGLIETGPGYMDESDPYGALFRYFKRVAEKPVLAPFEQRRDPEFPFSYLAFKNGTCWTMLARPCIGKIWDTREQRYKLALRLESRIEGTGPMAELVAQFWGKLCMLEALIDQERRALEIIPDWDALSESAHDAMFNGLDGYLRLHGGPVPFRQNWVEDVLPRVKIGHGTLGFTPETYDRYYPLLEGRLRGSGSYVADRFWDLNRGQDPHQIARDYVLFCQKYARSGYAGMRKELGME